MRFSITRIFMISRGWNWIRNGWIVAQNSGSGNKICLLAGSLRYVCWQVLGEGTFGEVKLLVNKANSPFSIPALVEVLLLIFKFI